MVRFWAAMIRFWPVVIAAWLGVGLLFQLVAPKWEAVAHDGNVDYLPAQLTSVRAQRLLNAAFPGPSPLLTSSDVDHPLRLAQKILAQAAEEAPSPGKRLFSLLKPEQQSAVREAADEAKQGSETAGPFREALNAVLDRSDFFDEESFANIPEADERLRVRETHATQSPEEAEAAQAREIQAFNRRLLEVAFPEDITPLPQGKVQSRAVVIVQRPDAELRDEDFYALQRLADKISEDNFHSLPIVSVWTPRTPVLGQKLVSADQRAALLSFGLTTEFMETANMQVVEELLKIIEEFKQLPNTPAGLEFAVTGSGVVGGDIMIATEHSIRNTESATIALVLVMLLVVYQAPLLVVVPILTIGVSVWVALNLCAILACYPALNFQIFTTSKVFIVVILFGAGTDFCLFLISRYKENLDHGIERTQSLIEALDQVAHVVSASAFTTICGLGVMWFGLFGKYHYTGPTIGLCLAVALAASVTLAPALLQMFGSMVFWPFRERHTRQELVVAKLQERIGLGVWTRTAKLVMDYPGVILALSVLTMAPFAYAAGHVTVSFDALAELPPERPSVFGTELIDKRFSQGDNGPIVVVVYRKEGGLNEKEGRAEIARLTKLLWDMRSPADAEGNAVKEGVREVRSLVEPLGGKPGMSNFFSSEGRAKLSALKHPRTLEQYMSTVPKLAGKVTQLEVVLVYNPFSRAAEEWIAKIEATLKKERETNPYWKNASFDLAGVSSGIRDLNTTTTRDLYVIQPLVVLVVFGVLIVLLRDVVVCIYLMVSVLFSYYVTLGTTQLLFEWLYGASFDGLDWKVPLFLFVILVAVGMDYNIYLVARVVEEQHKRGPIEGIRFALVRTGGIITSCGMIMAGTFLTMTSGHLKGLTELGFALGFGVLLDTFVVRTLLVPAFMFLLYQHFRHTPPPDTAITHVEDVEGDRMEESMDREVEQIIRESGADSLNLDVRRSTE